MLPAYFSTIPVSGKTPLIPWTEFQTRQATKEEVEGWGPGERGIVTGPISRVFVLDIDGEEGAKSIAAYQIPRTWTVKTPHGTHYYFRWTEQLEQKVTTRTKILEGVDVRGEGGYVKFYGWLRGPNAAPLANPPQWLLDLLPSKGTQSTPNATSIKNDTSTLSKFNEIMNGMKNGNRNESFTRIAGGLRSRGYKPEEIFNLLQPNASQVAFSDTELRTVCNSVGRYEPKLVLNDEQGSSIEEFLNNADKTTWICEPFFADGSIGIIGGLPESRKSWVVLDLALECARGGGLWLNKFPVKGRKVLLIDQERSKSEVQRRLKALMLSKGLESTTLKGALFVRCGTSTRIDLQHSFDALMKELNEIKPELVLIDSFATFHTKEESNRMEIQQVLERIKQIRQAIGCAIIFIHHCTKQSFQSQRDGQEPSYLDLAGNVAIPAAAEACLGIVKHGDDSSFVYHTKSTLGSKAAPFGIKVTGVEQIKVEAY